MIEATAAAIARAFHDFLGKVQRGETVVIRKHGRAIARLIPDSGFMSGKKAADLFRTHRAVELDRQTAQAIQIEIAKLDQEADRALAH
jgi:antitoxin (DNA-binding transcriptional repressor) of toxin-antitoxin stability system